MNDIHQLIEDISGIANIDLSVLHQIENGKKAPFTKYTMPIRDTIHANSEDKLFPALAVKAIVDAVCVRWCGYGDNDGETARKYLETARFRLKMKSWIDELIAFGQLGKEDMIRWHKEILDFYNQGKTAAFTNSAIVEMAEAQWSGLLGW